MVDLGDEVRKNQFVARIDDAEYSLKVNGAKAAVGVPNTNLNETRNMLDIVESDQDRIQDLHSEKYASGCHLDHAVILVGYTNLLGRRNGMDAVPAIRETGRKRPRPILVTVMATMLGLLPLALGIGEGGESRAPQVRAIIGGLLSSIFTTLLFVPVVYSIAETDSPKKINEKNCTE